jgi:prolyl 4-hydroxylase
MLVRTIDNFLTQEECAEIISLTEQNNQKSLVVDDSSYGRSVHDSRTSSTSYFSEDNKTVLSIRERVAKELKIDVRQIERLQGQKYEPGQFFRPHYDYISNGGDLHRIAEFGNRTWTCLIYLNDDFEGGTTNFPKLDLEIKPKKGMALIFQNMKDGQLVEESLHEGKDVVNGFKYIVTAWIRERYVDLSKTYSNDQDLPKFTELGFKKLKIPQNIWDYILEIYDKAKAFKTEENLDNKAQVIPSSLGTNSADIFSLDNLPDMRAKLHLDFLQLHKEWAGVEIEPTWIYGIRSYNKGASLYFHRDRIATHHISSIICVDKDLADQEDWALNIEGHDGKMYDVYLQPGEMILYESAKCLHGRKDTFKGEFFRNLFVHYKLKDYTHIERK